MGGFQWGILDPSLNIVCTYMRNLYKWAACLCLNVFNILSIHRENSNVNVLGAFGNSEVKLGNSHYKFCKSQSTFKKVFAWKHLGNCSGRGNQFCPGLQPNRNRTISIGLRAVFWHFIWSKFHWSRKLCLNFQVQPLSDSKLWWTTRVECKPTFKENGFLFCCVGFQNSIQCLLELSFSAADYSEKKQLLFHKKIIFQASLKQHRERNIHPAPKQRSWLTEMQMI